MDIVVFGGSLRRGGIKVLSGLQQILGEEAAKESEEDHGRFCLLCAAYCWVYLSKHKRIYVFAIYHRVLS